MITRNLWIISVAFILLFLMPGRSSQTASGLKIIDVTVQSETLALPSRGVLNLGTHPRNVSFSFRAGSAKTESLARVEAKLEGFDTNWHSGGGYMFVGLRFFKANWDQIGQTNFPVTGNSTNWTGTLETSPLVHRRKSLIVPPNAAYVWVVMSSAGPPATEGIYAVAGLTLLEENNDGSTVQLVKPPANVDASVNQITTPDGWWADGTHLSMAKIVNIRCNPPLTAMVIEDDDPIAHAEWHNLREVPPIVHPGRKLTLNWDEMYSIGEAGLRSVLYEELRPGTYRFQVIGVSVRGQPDGNEASIDVFVPQAIWKRPTTLALAGVLLLATLFGSARYGAWIRMRREMLVLKQQQNMEQERLRIARDIHDDLGARVTQISLLASSALDSSSRSEAIQSDLSQIKQISRDLISALYETVWTVNPEYDNLSALGDYLCQMVDKLCKRGAIRCRLDSSVLPDNVQVSGHARHNLAMAMKEAINNAVKHANCSEITINITFEDGIFQITIHDDGGGFAPGVRGNGNGLRNMKHRMEDIGGSCTIVSRPEGGATVRLCLAIRPLSTRIHGGTEKA